MESIWLMLERGTYERVMKYVEWTFHTGSNFFQFLHASQKILQIVNTNHCVCIAGYFWSSSFFLLLLSFFLLCFSLSFFLLLSHLFFSPDCFSHTLKIGLSPPLQHLSHRSFLFFPLFSSFLSLTLFLSLSKSIKQSSEVWRTNQEEDLVMVLLYWFDELEIENACWTSDQEGGGERKKTERERERERTKKGMRKDKSEKRLFWDRKFTWRQSKHFSILSHSHDSFLPIWSKN